MRSRESHGRGFSYRLTKFDLAVTPVLCHGAHGCGQGSPVLGPPISLLGQVQLPATSETGFSQVKNRALT